MRAFIVGQNAARIGVATTATARTAIHIGMRTERPSPIAIRDMGTDTRHPGHGPGMDTRTNRGLGDHPRIRTSRRGGHAETAGRSVASDGPS